MLTTSPACSDSQGTSSSSVKVWPGPTWKVRPLPVSAVLQPSARAGSTTGGGHGPSSRGAAAWLAAAAGASGVGTGAGALVNGEKGAYVGAAAGIAKFLAVLALIVFAVFLALGFTVAKKVT